MRRIVEYKLLSADYDWSVHSSVNLLLDEGWELYGNPTIAKSEHSTRYAQAMVRYHEEETPNVPEPRNHYPEGMFRI